MRTPPQDYDKTRDIHLIQINYKSGIVREFWCYTFSIDMGEYKWKCAGDGDHAKPLRINPDDIESVWQLTSVKGH